MYIINNKQQLEYTKDMTVLRKNMETFEVYYHDPETGQLWKSFFPRGFQERKGPKLLRPEPMPENLDLQLEICLNGHDDSGAVGLGIEWSTKPAQWPAILNAIEKNQNNYLRSNLNTFLHNLGVLQPEEMLQEVGVNFLETGLSQDDFTALKKQARWIKIKRFFRL